MSNIEIVIGSPYNDVLTGNVYGNVLVGGGGNDVITGGGGRSVLIGGDGADTIQGGAADDLIIGGYTAFDSNPAAQHALFAEWQSADTYANRVGYLSGTLVDLPHFSGPRLVLGGTGATVFADAWADGIMGGGGSDWVLPS